jgi:hypothetical protein
VRSSWCLELHILLFTDLFIFLSVNSLGLFQMGRALPAEVVSLL